MSGRSNSQPVKDYNDKSGLAYYWLEANIGRVLLVVLFAGLGLWGLLLEGRADLGLGRRLVRGMGPELAGIVIAAVTIDALAERRQRQSRKAQLIRQLGSKYRDVTEMALLELEHERWLYDGTLKKAQLIGSNLSGARLWGANLSDAELLMAKLDGANLLSADLSGALLFKANLSRASLLDVNLDGANLERANLSSAKYLSIEQLDMVKSLEGCIMPDGIQLAAGESVSGDAIDGPTFEQWKAFQRAKRGGKGTDVGHPSLNS